MNIQCCYYYVYQILLIAEPYSILLFTFPGVTFLIFLFTWPPLKCKAFSHFMIAMQNAFYLLFHMRKPA